MRRHLTILSILAVPAVAAGHKPAPGHVPTEEEMQLWHPRCDDVDTTPPSLALIKPQRRILYLNRQGGTFKQGFSDDSTKNESLVMRIYNKKQTATVPPYPHGDATWQATVECVKDTFKAYSVEITETDPGNTPHIEVVTGGVPEDIGGDSSTTAGVAAPHPCDNPRVIEKGIVFTFAAHPSNHSVNSQCWTIAQEAGHALGLDHEYLCEDPMTYLYTCGNYKRFQNADAPCGELNGPWAACPCGNQLQNSHAWLTTILGPADFVAPTVSILSPQDGAEVPLGFKVVAEAADDTPWLTKVELWVDGEYASVKNTAPFELDTPSSLAVGQHTIEVRAYDNGANVATARIVVNVVPGCASDSECGDGKICMTGACLGAMGSPCGKNADCASGLCASDGSGNVCTQTCGSSNDCPSGFACMDAPGGGLDKCFAEAGGGCEAGRLGGRAPVGAVWLLLGALALLARRRR